MHLPFDTFSISFILYSLQLYSLNILPLLNIQFLIPFDITLVFLIIKTQYKVKYVHYSMYNTYLSEVLHDICYHYCSSFFHHTTNFVRAMKRVVFMTAVLFSGKSMCSASHHRHHTHPVRRTCTALGSCPSGQPQCYQQLSARTGIKSVSGTSNRSLLTQL